MNIAFELLIIIFTLDGTTGQEPLFEGISEFRG